MRIPGHGMALALALAVCSTSAAVKEPFTMRDLPPEYLSQIAAPDLTIPPLYGGRFPDAPVREALSWDHFLKGTIDTGDCVILKGGAFPDARAWGNNPASIAPKEQWVKLALSTDTGTVYVSLPYASHKGTPAWPSILDLSLHAYGHWLVWPLGSDIRSFGPTPLDEAYRTRAGYHNLVCLGTGKPNLDAQATVAVLAEAPDCRLAVVEGTDLWKDAPAGTSFHQSRMVILTDGLVMLVDQVRLRATEPASDEIKASCQWGMNFGGYLTHSLEKVRCDDLNQGPILCSTTRHRGREWNATVMVPDTGDPNRVGLRFFWVSAEDDDNNFGLLPAPQFGSVPVSEYFDHWYLWTGVPRVWVPRTLIVPENNTSSKASLFISVMEPFRGEPHLTHVTALGAADIRALELSFKDGAKSCVLLNRTTARFTLVKRDAEGRLTKIRMTHGQKVILPEKRTSELVSCSERIEALTVDYLPTGLRAYAMAPEGGRLAVAFTSAPTKTDVNGHTIGAAYSNKTIDIPLGRGRNIIRVTAAKACAPVLKKLDPYPPAP